MSAMVVYRREFITRFNIGGYNYDALVLAKAISDTAVSIINNTLSMKSRL